MKSTTLLAVLMLFVTQFSFASTDPVLPMFEEEISAASLEGIYETSGKGGYAHYYISEEGGEIYMVGLNFDQSFACAFRGNLRGNTLSGEWLSLPYGQFKGNGDVVFNISNRGRTLTVEDSDFRHMTLNKVRRANKYPHQSGGFFSGGSTRDVTGTYQGENAHRVFVRQLRNQVVFYSESFRTDTNNGRPGMASVFFGNRSGNNFEGVWVDLPLGMTENTGEASFEVIGPKYFRFDGGYFPGVAYRSFK